MNAQSDPASEPFIVDVISDVVCPWCFVGKRRIEGAARLLGRNILARWHPFELNPQMPAEGMARTPYRVRKFGSLERSRFLEEQVATVGRQVGIEFHQELIERIPNTLPAHVLLHLALLQSVEAQNRTAERLFVGYFSRGKDVGDPKILLSIAKEVGIAAVTSPEVFDDPALRKIVREAEEQIRTAGVQAVPNISYKRQLIASGAQPEELLANALRPLLSGVAHP